jgi:putative membrane protein
MKILIRLLLNGLAVFVTAAVLPGIAVDGIKTSNIVAIVLGIVNTFLKPVLLLLTLPITLMTLGLFTLVINAGMIMLTAALVEGFDVANWLWAIIFSVVLAIVNGALNALAD